ncbi:hypothetical protein PGT21_013585 [Puccinia graminis f. sp. tritici]|uniref:Uncharacterized protein n=1 Tax=Puccinia graminis f. sp. tritici TaxID=56615 RepID=A0A5B0QTB8_PUCGR|nr:hypothetical protein PGT21_013585 [Puccinia graminis f. sp. tritici]
MADDRFLQSFHTPCLIGSAHPPLHNHLAPLVEPFPIPPSLAILLLPSLQPEPGSLP